jgi:2-haloacid dehalogenase
MSLGRWLAMINSTKYIKPIASSSIITHRKQAIDRTIGDRLRRHGVGIEAFASLWIEVSGREYTNLSIRGNYTPSSKIFGSLFYRILYQCGISDPRSLATDEEREAIIAGYGDLRFRPGAKECIQKLRDAGFTVWGLTTGNRETVLGYFTNSGVEMSKNNLMACDDIQVAKPDLECYKPSLKMLSAERSSPPWFAAAHLVR